MYYFYNYELILLTIPFNSLFQNKIKFIILKILKLQPPLFENKIKYATDYMNFNNSVVVFFFFYLGSSES